jgi:hypothetical protein
LIENPEVFAETTGRTRQVRPRAQTDVAREKSPLQEYTNTLRALAHRSVEHRFGSCLSFRGGLRRELEVLASRLVQKLFANDRRT